MRVLLAAVALAVALVGDLLGGDPLRTVTTPWAPPGPALPLGADGLGRDVLARVLAGGRQLTLVALGSAIVASTLGLAAGLWAGWSASAAARALRSGADLLLALPLLLVALVAAVRLPGPAAVLVGTVLGGTPLTLRVMADATRGARHAGYVEAALTRGESPVGVAVREVLPAHAGLAAADLGQRTVLAVTLGAALAALGFGPPPPAPDWAVMLRENLTGIGLNPAATLAPALALAVVAGSVAALAGLRRTG
jgi:peptide/nickel transport system permease protein